MIHTSGGRFYSLMFALMLVITAATPAVAQKAAVKTNLVGDAMLSPNAAVEFRLAPRWTLDLSGQLCAWSVSDHRWKHWVVQPEARYWFCNTFAGHFVGMHVHGGQFNVGNIDADFSFLNTHFDKLKDRRYQGWFAGAGVSYGYDWILGKHWNLEAEIGFGWSYTRSDVYPCATCGSKIQSGKVHNYVGPTKVALNIVYLF